MADYATHIAGISESLRPLFYRVMEETDNGVLYDHYEKRRIAHEEHTKALEEKRGKGGRKK